MLAPSPTGSTSQSANIKQSFPTEFARLIHDYDQRREDRKSIRRKGKANITDIDKLALANIAKYTATHRPCYCAETELVPGLMRIGARPGARNATQSIHVFSIGVVVSFVKCAGISSITQHYWKLTDGRR
jgi:hypothetical protein